MKARKGKRIKKVRGYKRKLDLRDFLLNAVLYNSDTYTNLYKKKDDLFNKLESDFPEYDAYVMNCSDDKNFYQSVISSMPDGEMKDLYGRFIELDDKEFEFTNNIHKPEFERLTDLIISGKSYVRLKPYYSYMATYSTGYKEKVIVVKAWLINTKTREKFNYYFNEDSQSITINKIIRLKELPLITGEISKIIRNLIIFN